MGLFNNLFGKKDEQKKVSTGRRPAHVETGGDNNVIYAPVAGRAEQRENIPDPVFSRGLMGELLGVWPKKGVVYAPIGGSVTAAMPHAIGIKAENGLEVLVHVGIDTVEMNGEGFDVWVEAGEKVRAGDAVVSFDLEKVRAAKHPEIVVTVVTETGDLGPVEIIAGDAVQVGEPIMTVGA